MPYKFSPSNLGFYIEGLHQTIPSDVVDVTDERHAEVFSELRDGMILGFDPNTGQPMAVKAPPFVKTWSMIRATRDNMLDNTDWTQVSDNKLTDEERAEWKAYRQKLRDITKVSDVNQVVWPAEPPSATS